MKRRPTVKQHVQTHRFVFFSNFRRKALIFGYVTVSFLAAGGWKCFAAVHGASLET